MEEPDLREVYLGEWEGGRFRERAVSNDPVFLDIFREERWDVIPGAEPLETFDERVWSAFQRIVAAHPDQRVMVVAHGGVIAHLLHRVSESRRFAFSATDNASISEVVAGPDRIVLRRYNDVSHLASTLRLTLPGQHRRARATSAAQSPPGLRTRGGSSSCTPPWRGRFTGLPGCTPRRCDGMRSRSSIHT